MVDQALSDIKVLDFSHVIVGPYCAKLLGYSREDEVRLRQQGVI